MFYLFPFGAPQTSETGQAAAHGNFNEEVGLDVLHISDCDGVKRKFLNVVDLGFTFQVVIWLADESTPEISNAFYYGW